jgi:two-component system KDP operon response regulator KdpE
VVGDEVQILRLLQRSLMGHGYQVFTASNGKGALERLAHSPPDLVLLDLDLSDMGGLEVCRQVRAQSVLPIIALSVKDAERDKVQALDLGADDYVSKPFGINEVLARVRAALRHTPQVRTDTEPIFSQGTLQVDFTQRLVTSNGQEVRLTPTEYNLLKAPIKERGKIMTRKTLLSLVWGTDHARDFHSLHVYINHLRCKIEPDPTNPCYILTVSGVGYYFNTKD